MQRVIRSAIAVGHSSGVLVETRGDDLGRRAQEVMHQSASIEEPSCMLCTLCLERCPLRRPLGSLPPATCSAAVPEAGRRTVCQPWEANLAPDGAEAAAGGGLSGDQLPEDDAQAVDVHLFAAAGPQQHLRGLRFRVGAMEARIGQMKQGASVCWHTICRVQRAGSPAC